MAEPMINIQNLVKNYGEIRAVDHLNLEIQKGEIFGLLGPNGAGKTTIILSLLGLTEPTSGTVSIKGFNSTTEPLNVKALTGYLPDEVGFSDNDTGLESLIYTARLNGKSHEEAADSARELLKTVGLQDAGHKKTKTYSKGMIQRLGLADVLIKEPEIMVLDEPTIGIDPKGINEFLEMIRTLSKEKGITVLLCSHLLHQVQKICDRVGILVDGQLRALGDISKLADKLFGDQDTMIRAEISPITDELLRRLSDQPGITGVQANDSEIILKGNREVAAAIARTVVQNGSDLYKLTYREYGLDEIYEHYFEGGSIDV